MVGQGHGAVDGDQFADRDPPVEREPGPVRHHHDEQDAGQHDLDRGDQRPHARAVHGRPADLLRGGAVAAEEQLLAADAAQHAQPGDGVGGQLRGPARLLALDVGPAGGAGEERQHRKREDRHADGHHGAQGRRVDDEARADGHQDDGARREPGQGLDEPADLLDVAGGDGDDLARGDPPGQDGAELGGLAGQELLHPGGRGDPVGDGGPVQHHVAGRDRRAEEHEQHPGEREPPAVAVHHRLDGEPDAERQPGDAQVVQQPPEQGLHLPTELLTADPDEEPRARTDVGHPGIGVGKISNLHGVPGAPGRTGETRAGDARRRRKPCKVRFFPAYRQTIFHPGGTDPAMAVPGRRRCRGQGPGGTRPRLRCGGTLGSVSGAVRLLLGIPLWRSRRRRRRRAAVRSPMDVSDPNAAWLIAAYALRPVITPLAVRESGCRRPQQMRRVGRGSVSPVRGSVGPWVHGREYAPRRDRARGM